MKYLLNSEFKNSKGLINNVACVINRPVVNNLQSVVKAQFCSCVFLQTYACVHDPLPIPAPYVPITTDLQSMLPQNLHTSASNQLHMMFFRETIESSDGRTQLLPLHMAKCTYTCKQIPEGMLQANRNLWLSGQE